MTFSETRDKVKNMLFDDIVTRKPLSFWRQVFNLFLIEMSNWRWSWRGMVVVGTLAPLLSVLALGVFARDAGIRALGYVLTGNVVLSLMFGLQNNVEGHFLFMRTQGVLAYFATLPVKKHALLLAVVLAFFVLSLPAILVTAFVGAWLLNVPLALHPLLILVIPLCALPNAGIGALIGVRARNLQEGGAYNLLTIFIMMGLGPVVIPPERLPAIFLILGKFSPATYAASALRQVLLGPVTNQLWLDLAVLLLFTIAMFWVVGRWLDWRRE